MQVDRAVVSCARPEIPTSLAWGTASHVCVPVYPGWAPHRRCAAARLARLHKVNARNGHLVEADAAELRAGVRTAPCHARGIEAAAIHHYTPLGLLALTVSPRWQPAAGAPASQTPSSVENTAASKQAGNS